MKAIRAYQALGSVLVLTLAAGMASAQEKAPQDRCMALTGTTMPDPSTHITTAALHGASPAEARATGDTRPFPPTPAMPAHCEIIGKMQERSGANGQTYAIKFHLRLPTAWNGRFFFQGGGGTDGNLGDATGIILGQDDQRALTQGYAVISSDSGHDNGVNNDPKLQGLATFGHDAVARHNYGFGYIGPVAQAGKALIRAYYGRPAQLTYFVGGSKGGQEGMMAVQRFPQEFDAALIGYPGFHLAHASIAQLADGQAMAEAARALGQTGGDGLPLINKAMSDEDILLAQHAILAACDGLDGTPDGMVENFTACTTPRVLPHLSAIACKGDTPADKNAQCLLPAQILALRKVFEGPKLRDGKPIYSDWPWDAGIGAQTARGVTQGWRIWKMGGYASATNNGALIRLGAPSNSSVFRSPPLDIADTVTELSRYALGVDLDTAYAAAHVKWGSLNEAPVDFMHADATDLTPFTRRGGKIIIFHGVSDPVFSINDTLRWLAQVDAREQGRSGRFIQFYAVPGMNHGRGGPATDHFDIFSQLVAWREQGVAPAKIVATAGNDTPWPGRTRLLCPYPQQPRRTGGDIETAASFHCEKL